MSRTQRTALSGALLLAIGIVGSALAEDIAIPDQPNAIALSKPKPKAMPEQWERRGEYRSVRNVVAPTLTPYLPDPAKATGAAVIVAPGGGFTELEFDYEGTLAAQWLADHGIAAFLLKYRLRETPHDAAGYAAWQVEQRKTMMARASAPPSDAPASAPRIGPPAEALEDGKAALHMVRARAKEWHVDPARVGFVGFSAGAILALSLGLDEDVATRPNFIAPIYGAMGERAVPPDAPPMFVALALDDPLMARGGQKLGLIDAYRTAGRPVEAHLYGTGGHGFGMKGTKHAAALWIDEFYAWMTDGGFLKPAG